MSAPGELIGGRYRLVKLVGRGGMGTVWEARDERLHRAVALKLLHRQHGLTPADADLANQRAMREARITARLHHRHAVPVFDVVEHEERPCLVMQFLPSIPLSTLLRDSGPLLPAEAAKMGAQIASALAAAHAVGIVHRDIKPGNILIADDGTAMISDFGISHAFGDAALTATGLVHGTPAYLAPEVARGAEASFAADVFSLGSTLYAAVEGSPPFGLDPNTMALLHRVASGDVPPPQRSGPLTGILRSMLATDPRDRPTMKQASDAISEVARASAPLPPTRTPPPAATLLLPAEGQSIGSPPDEPTRRIDQGVEPPSAQPTRPLSVPAEPTIAAQPTVSTQPTVPVAATRHLPAVPDSRPTPAPAPRQHGVSQQTARPRRRPVVPIAIAALIVLALVAGAVWFVSNRPSTPADDAPTSSRSAKPSPSPARPSQTPSRSTTPSQSPTPSAGTATAAELAAAITSYYALMPDGTDQGWERLTPAYQVSPSGGRKSYEKFWKNVEQVSISNVVGLPPDEAEATIRYVLKRGGVVEDRTRFGLVEDGGVLKINSSRVLG